MKLYVKESDGSYKVAQPKDVFKVCQDALPSGKKIQDADDAKHETGLKLQGQSRELFGCLWLTAEHRVIKWEIVSEGTLASNTIYPRELVKRGIELNAAAVIIAHNHPSGSTTPSQQDKDLTAVLKQTLNLIDIRVLDHFIIGREVVSMMELGMV